MKKIAVQGCTVKITDTTLTGLPQIQTLPSEKTKAGGAKVYRGDLTVLAATITDGSGNTATAVSITISGSSQKTIVDGQPVVLEGDSGKLENVIFYPPGSGKPSTHTVEFKITAAGQNTAETE